MRPDYRLQRVNATQWALPNRWGVPTRLFAGEGVPIERAAITELEAMLELVETVAAYAAAAPQMFDAPPAVEAVALSSDFHKGSGIPIGTTLHTQGFAVPQAIGKDINCGMRLHRTNLTREQVEPLRDALEARLRHSFFQGGRRIGLTRTQREAMLAEGIPGLLNTDALSGAAWLHAAEEIDHIHGGGGAPTAIPAAFADYIAGSGDATTVSYDTQIGSLGGGNHFAEIQVVAKLHDRATAHAWGLREGQVVVMVHSGSLGVGYHAASLSNAVLRSLLPPSVPLPRNGIMPLPLGEACADVRSTITSAIQTATNFAFANRFFLARMVIHALEALLGEVSHQLLWDAPHNLMWDAGDGTVIHRKGSTPARGAEAMAGTAFAWGEPVIVPGSMGAPSFLLRGQGNAEALESACHGAGRAIARGEASRGHDADLDAFLREFRVVTPVDPQMLRSRPEMLAQWRSDLKQEAPFAYKSIGPIIETLRTAQVAQPVAEFHPLMTVKG